MGQIFFLGIALTGADRYDIISIEIVDKRDSDARVTEVPICVAGGF